MNVAPKVFLICYDICCTKRWRKVYNVVRSHGVRMQYSVFRCVLSELQLARMVDALVVEIAHDQDQVLIVTLGSEGAERTWSFQSLGLAMPAHDRGVKQF